MPWQFGEEGLAFMRSIKKAVDPNNILNPGKMFLMEKGE
jgi:FAD/FMN-containing dehydrogenase